MSLVVSFRPTQGQLRRKTIIWPLKDAAPQIFTRAWVWPRLASPHPTGDEGPPTIFNEQNLKIGPKFNVWAPITLEWRGVTSQNFSTWCAARQTWEFRYNFLGACAPKISEGQKHPKFAATSDTFRFWSRISPQRVMKFCSWQRHVARM